MSEDTETVPVPVRKSVERLEDLETGLKRLAKNTSQDMLTLKESVRNLTEVIQSMVRLEGEEYAGKIQAQILASREEVRLQKVAVEKDRMAQYVIDGKLVQAEIADDNTVVVGAEYDKTGAAVGLGYISVEFNSFVPEVKDKLRGQPVGFKLELPDGQLEVLEVYTILAPPDAPPVISESAPEVAEPTPEAVVEAAVESELTQNV